MIEFDKEAYKKLIKEIADGPEEALEIKTIILSYIIIHQLQFIMCQK